MEYFELIRIAKKLKCKVKKHITKFESWDDFKVFYNLVSDKNWTLDGNFIEGIVFEDSSGFMFKEKSGFYDFWKKMRTVADQTLKNGYIKHTGGLLEPEANLFYGFCKELYLQKDPDTKQYPFSTDIISLRELFKESVKRV